MLCVNAEANFGACAEQKIHGLCVRSISAWRPFPLVGAAVAMGSETEEARRRYRNTLFDREAKAAASLLEQVRQYVGRSGKCQVTDFEDLCTIHHAISNLFERVKRFSSLESMPRVYRNAVKAANIERPAGEADDAQLLILQGTNDLEDPPSETVLDLTPPWLPRDGEKKGGGGGQEGVV
ncbi:unnamed protein product [Symbiodinium natans]|uniref:Uncharacterized protein n=1 Tax=Symbiodinium natans TaxID=878477 RepID=A0A812PLK6_9DINO|nr:unnamed protein product [Symbiodinium natans]